MLDAQTRFVGITAPTGSGKSLIYMAAQQLFSGRTVILTSTKGLQDQLGTDFGSVGLQDLRGQRNYPCHALEPGGDFSHLWPSHSQPAAPTCEDGPCHVGAACPLKEAGCEYYDRIRLAAGRLLVTNYALWLAQARYGQGLGKVDLLICDEAHQLPDELAGSLTIKIDKWLLAAVGIETSPQGTSVQEWRDWGRYHGQRLRKRLESLPKPSSGQEVKYRRRMKSAEKLLGQLEEMEPGNWVPDHTDQSWVWEVLNPSAYAEQLLYQGAGRVVLLSATLTPKTLHLAGIQDATVWECPSRFPVSRRPVWYIPTVRVDARLKPLEAGVWIKRIDQIISPRQSVKGLVHTVSYKRRDQILAGSSYMGHMVTHSQVPGDVARVVKRFKLLDKAGVLVSPSLTTGWDFPHEQCRYQIICKLPFPDTRSAIMQARCEIDPELLLYLTAQALVQTVGRGMRDAGDWCETFIIDDHWQWFHQKARHLMPAWFLAAIKRSPVLPPPYKGD